MDFARISTLQRWKELLRHVNSYDIMCQYAIHLQKRTTDLVSWAKKTLKNVIDMLPESLVTIFAVPKFHLPGHIAKCSSLFSFNYLPGVGMTDGEGPERIWSVMNPFGNRTREMSAGHRHNVINEAISDGNWRKTQSLGKSESCAPPIDSCSS